MPTFNFSIVSYVILDVKIDTLIKLIILNLVPCCPETISSKNCLLMLLALGYASPFG